MTVAVLALKARKAAAAVLCSQCMRCSCVLCCLGLLGMKLQLYTLQQLCQPMLSSEARVVCPAAPFRGLHAGFSSAERGEGAVCCMRCTASTTRPPFGLLVWQGSPARLP